MNVSDQQKVIKAGFILIRWDNYPSPRIKVKDENSREWRTLGAFDTKTARDKRMKELLELSNVIED